MKQCAVFWDKKDQEKLLSWWERLKDSHGWRAELRHAEKPEDVLLCQGFRFLYFDLVGTRWIKEENILGLAAVAGVLAHVEFNDDHSFAELCALPSSGSEKPALSELRFSQIQKSRSLDELFTRTRRAIQVLGKKANVVSLADDILHWYLEIGQSEENSEPRNRILVRWGMEYFQNLPRTETR